MRLFIAINFNRKTQLGLLSLQDKVRLQARDGDGGKQALVGLAKKTIG